VQDKEIAKSKKFFKKFEESVVKISAQSEHCFVLVTKGLNPKLYILVFILGGFRKDKQYVTHNLQLIEQILNSTAKKLREIYKFEPFCMR
jgi:hypothetical protein